MKIENDEVLFSSGHRRAIYREYIGLSTAMDVVYGSDGSLFNPDFENDEEEPLSHTDLVELADYMLDLWQQFREKYATVKKS